MRRWRCCWRRRLVAHGRRHWRCCGCFFSFLLSCSLLLLPLAVRLFYCSSSSFPLFFLVPGKEKLMVMLSFVCWLLASLTFSSSLFLLPIPCSAAAGSCGWCCRKVKLMVMCFLLIFLCWVDVLTPGSSCLVWLLCVFPNFIPSCCPCFSFFLLVLPLFIFSASCLYRLSVFSLLGPSSPPSSFPPFSLFRVSFPPPLSLLLPYLLFIGRRGCGCCDEVVQPVVAAVELEEDGVGFLWQRKKEEEEKSAEIG